MAGTEGHVRHAGNGIGVGVLHGRWLAIANWGLVAGLVLTLWIPLWWRHQVSTPAVDAADIEGWRSVPAPSVAEALWELALDWDMWGLRGSDTLQRADKILDGRLSLAGRPAVEMREIDWWADPFRDPTWRLQLQGLRHVRILLAAWHVSGRPAYLSKAGEVISSWITFARKWPFGGGYMWNDQATADRAVVLSAFWAAYARSVIYDPVIGAAVLRSLAQHVGFLTDPRHFAFVTNHGVIQNVALLHVAATLPILGERAGIVDIAVRRLTLQYKILVTPEGILTEHSPGYQLLTVNLLRAASRYLEILGRPIPEEWRDTLGRLESALVQFARPDRSLPQIGDTVEAPQRGHPWPNEMVGALTAGKRLRQFLAPCGGYAILWEPEDTANGPGKGRQVVMTVSNFPGHGHKHADELSVYLFGEGRTWLTGPGYWPYALPGREYAISWTGANAPSYEDEPAIADRRAELVGSAQVSWGNFVEMQRSGPAGFRARRQVAWIRPDWVIVSDQVSAPPGKQIVLRWLFAPDVVVEKEGDEAWVVRPLHGPPVPQLQVWVLTPQPAAMTVTRGGQQPFGGWVYTGEEEAAAQALHIRPQGQQAFVVTVLAFNSRHDGARIAKPRLMGLGERWSLSFGTDAEASYRFDRYPSSLKLTSSATASEAEQPIRPVSCPDEVKQAYVSIRSALEAEYGALTLSLRPMVPMRKYRQATFLLIGAWICQEMGLLVIRRRAPGLGGILRLISCLVLFVVGLLLFVRLAGTNVM